MRALLVGNGFDLNFISDLDKTKWRRKILFGNQHNYFEEFPEPIKKYWAEKMNDKNCEKLRISDNQFKRMKGVLNSTIDNKSIEEIFNDMERVLSKDGRDDLHTLFNIYIQDKTESINPKLTEELNKKYVEKSGKTKNANFIVEKLEGYDFIFTTNYDYILNRFLGENTPEERATSNVIHLHGELDKPESILLGLEKTDKSNKEIEKQVYDNCIKGIERTGKTYNSKNDSNIELDIYGWSIADEEDIIKVILNALVNTIYKGMVWEYSKEQIESTKIAINYYYFSDNDRNSILKLFKHDSDNDSYFKEYSFQFNEEKIEPKDFLDELKLEDLEEDFAAGLKNLRSKYKGDDFEEFYNTKEYVELSDKYLQEKRKHLKITSNKIPFENVATLELYKSYKFFKDENNDDIVYIMNQLGDRFRSYTYSELLDSNDAGSLEMKEDEKVVESRLSKDINSWIENMKGEHAK